MTVTTSDVISAWDLQEASGTINDIHSTQDGTNSGMNYQQSGIISTYSMSGDASSSDNIDISTFADISTADYSYQAWFNMDTLKNYNYILESIGASDNEFIISARVSSAGLLQVFLINNSNTVFSMEEAGLSASTNYHLVVTHDLSAKVFKLYLNGVYRNTVTYTGTLKQCNQLFIANDRNPDADNRALDGRIEQIVIFNKVLTDGSVSIDSTATGEIADLWNGGSGFLYPFAAATNLSLNVGDVWKDVDQLQINIGDVWKDVTQVQQNIGDVWKNVYG